MSRRYLIRVSPCRQFGAAIMLLIVAAAGVAVVSLPAAIGFPMRLNAGLVSFLCAWLAIRAARNGWRIMVAEARVMFGE